MLLEASYSLFLTINIKDSDAEVRLFNLTGRLLLDDHLADGIRIDLNRFGKGMYVLQVVSNGRVYTEKVVNQ